MPPRIIRRPPWVDALVTRLLKERGQTAAEMIKDVLAKRTFVTSSVLVELYRRVKE